MGHKISVDKKKCIGCGNCSAVCPGSFELKGNKAVAKKPVVEKLTCEKEAEAGCPVQAISVS
ncbi:ferredoxin [Candidatus Pacearchaeota archaeon]|nr:ferredoxin [Candidatus Pacearchaeota archaeon]|tara:strand:+ start:13471 stop:13656 length:186 start_codon:yes stop_codon:yes gene_type:complete